MTFTLPDLTKSSVFRDSIIGSGVEYEFHKTIEIGLKELCKVFKCESAVAFMNLNSSDFKIHTIVSADRVLNHSKYKNDSVSKQKIKDIFLEHSFYRFYEALSIPQEILGLQELLENKITNTTLFLIHGQMREIGFLVLINTHQPRTDDFLNTIYSSSIFSKVVSFLLRKEILKILVDIKKESLKAVKGQNKFENYVQTIAEIIAGSELLNYSVLSIRFYQLNDLPLFEKKSACKGIEWQDYKQTNSFFKCLDIREKNEPIYINKIDAQNINEFENSEWIKRNKLKAYACYPISYEDLVIGTISIFIPYEYDFYSFDKYFLTLFSQEIMSTYITTQYIKRLRLEDSKEEARNEIDTIEASEEIHAHKNDIVSLISTLNSLKKYESIKSAKQEIDKNVKRWAEKLGVITHHFDELIPEENAITSFKLSDVIYDILDYYHANIENLNIQIDTDNIDDFEMHTDRNRIFESISNIVHNAIKALSLVDKEPKEIIISSYHSEIDLMDYYTILIQDNAGTLNIKDKQKIFNKGYQKFLKGSGTGYGLYYSNKIALDYYGKIDVESCPNEFTQFYLHFWKNYVS